MDTATLKDYISNALVGRQIDFTPAAMERLFDTKYFKESELTKLDDTTAKASADKVIDEAVKRFNKRAKRSKVSSVKMREIDTRTVARASFEAKLLPWGIAKVEPEAEATDTEAEKPVEA